MLLGVDCGRGKTGGHPGTHPGSPYAVRGKADRGDGVDRWVGGAAQGTGRPWKGDAGGRCGVLCGAASYRGDRFPGVEGRALAHD